MTPPLACPAETPTILSFSGPDAVRFLNGQMTQAVDGLGDEAKPACITNAKGRLEHFVHLCQGPDNESIWVVSNHDDPEELRARLERYLIADDVEVEDLSGTWCRIHASGRLTGATFTRENLGPWGKGSDHWWPAGDEPTIHTLAPEEIEDLRIERALPRWGKELTPGILPPEAGLDSSAISYSKGCYIGQEVLSRMKTAGKVNRRLGLFEIPSGLTEGAPLELDGKEVGTLTSVAGSLPLALGYVKKAAFDQESLQTSAGPAHWKRWA
ncbi:YgfZ/GcvT domain-containing protein [Haloferula rosea]|uniref:Aminomethyltransferase folate-binding domain-containing protein n=1 Tax=Haloferula rosea TaxID=490093 RepID=A0A934VBU1_9BACT|nr:hypothetical protein [Haloferula rosea]MBK1827733.1 hypothetical protein [Haloferula rosea]